MPSVTRYWQLHRFYRPSGCRLSVTFVHPTQATEIFSSVSTPFGALANFTWPYVDIQLKFYGDRLRGTPPSEELNTREVAE